MQKKQSKVSKGFKLLLLILGTILGTLACIWGILLISAVVVFGDNFIPITKTSFDDYNDFCETLSENNSFAGTYFLKECPKSAEDMKYYWHRKVTNKWGAYSMILSEENYEKFKEERVQFYIKNAIDNKGISIIYSHQEGDINYIENSQMYESEMSFINEVLHNQAVTEQYYFLIINKFNTVNGICYNGVILNDATREVIEFSCEKMSEE